jgi:hypothetical protein
MTLPIELVGAWRRSGLFLDGVRKVDYCDVIWLQTPEWYADIRLLIDPTATPPVDGVPAFFYREFSFAGPASWSDPIITWDHRVDSNLEPSVDANPVVWVDGVAAERGTATVDGRPAPFVEEWLRMTDNGVEWSADHGPGWARIEVGRWAVELRDERPEGKFVATRYERDGHGWSAVGAVRA